MAQATKEQITALEKAQLLLFYHLVKAAAFRIGVAREFGLDSPQFIKFNAKFVPIVKSWVQREVKYERELLKKQIYGIIASGDLKYEDFFYSAALPKLNALVKKWAPDQIGGIGEPITLALIWAAIAIFGFWTAKEVVDDLTTTTQEKEALLKATQDTAKELGLTPEQAAGLISQTQAEASKGSGIGDTLQTLAMWGIGGFIVVQLVK